MKKQDALDVEDEIYNEILSFDLRNGTHLTSDHEVALALGRCGCSERFLMHKIVKETSESPNN